jgi:hypothetical protein
MADKENIASAENLLDMLRDRARRLLQPIAPPVEYVEFPQSIEGLEARLTNSQTVLVPPGSIRGLEEEWAEAKLECRLPLLHRSKVQRMLCIASIFCDPDLFSLLEKYRPFTRRFMNQIVQSYFRFWNPLGEQRTHWAKLIQNELKDFQSTAMQWKLKWDSGVYKAVCVQPGTYKSLAWKSADLWQQNQEWLFSEKAPAAFALKLHKMGVGQLCQQVGQVYDLHFGQDPDSIYEVIRFNCFKLFLADSPEAFMLKLPAVLEAWIKPEIDHRLVASLMHGVQERVPLAKDRLKKWLLLQYGDPRIKVTFWRSKFPDKTTTLFRSWLSQADLKFFFRFAFDGQPDEHRREAFWAPYLTHVINSRILITPELAWEKQAELKKMKKEGEITVLGEIKGSCTFLLETMKYYIVEFSGTGNAVYVFDKDDNRYQDTLKIICRLLQYEDIRQLSSTVFRLGSAVARISASDIGYTYQSIRCFHDRNHNWAYILSNWLSKKGINPHSDVSLR